MKNETMSPGSANNWPQVVDELRKERDDLQRKVTQLQAERDQLCKALLDLLREEVTVNEQEILSRIGEEKPLREFLRELRAEPVES